MLKGLKARSIGPAVMAGRVSEIAFDPQDLFTFYIGLGTGGVMKTSNNGGTFDAIFEKERAAAGPGAVFRQSRLRRCRHRPDCPRHDLRRPLRPPPEALVAAHRPGSD